MDRRENRRSMVGSYGAGCDRAPGRRRPQRRGCMQRGVRRGSPGDPVRPGRRGEAGRSGGWTCVRPDADAERGPCLSRRAGPDRRRSPRGGGGIGVVRDRAPRVAVVGGGVSGLTTAHRLLDGDPSTEVVVFEADERVGGKLRTVVVGGLTLPAGADSFLARKPWAVDLCRGLGLGPELL